MSQWRTWHPDPGPDWTPRRDTEGWRFSDGRLVPQIPRPEIKWGGLRTRCPVCHEGMPSGMCRFMGYTMHFATAHVGIPVFSMPEHLR